MLFSQTFIFNDVYVCGCVHISAGVLGGQKMALDLLELELKAVVSHLIWVLGIEPRPLCESSKRS